MNNIYITGIDLNLLTVLDALLAERSVTRAAVRLGLTQPAVSHALGRLRELFKDDLFVRTPRGMSPTPVALEAGADVRAALERVEGLFRRERGFNPAATRRNFLIGMSDYAAAVLLPGLTASLAAEAPAATLVVKNTSHGTGLAMLESGEAELIVGNFPRPPPHLRAELLFREQFVCAMRRGHPAMRGKLGLKAYTGFDHLHVSSRGLPYGIVDDALTARGRSRNVKLTVGHFLLAPLLLRDSDMIATEPVRLFHDSGTAEAVSVAQPPFAIPGFDVIQAWHARHDGDAGLVWLRGTIREILGTSVNT